MPILLEAFDRPAAEPEPEKGPSADWLEGHATGLAEGLSLGRAEAEAEGRHLSRALTTALEETAFGYAEAREQVLLALRPLFGLLIDRFLPTLAAEALAPWVVQALIDAARSDTDDPLSIALHPDRIATVRACLPRGFPATLRPDATLGRHAARLSLPDRESDLDLDACLAALREALSALLDDTARKVRHG